MGYKPTGRPNGRPRKNPAPELLDAPEPAKLNRRVRKEFSPPPRRRYVSGQTPISQTPVDTTPPGFGQRKRDRHMGPSLHPTPLKV